LVGVFDVVLSHFFIVYLFCFFMCFFIGLV